MRCDGLARGASDSKRARGVLIRDCLRRSLLAAESLVSSALRVGSAAAMAHSSGGYAMAMTLKSSSGLAVCGVQKRLIARNASRVSMRGLSNDRGQVLVRPAAGEHVL